MPLLQGQPFKLIQPPDIYPVDSEVYTIQHTGEKFLNKSDYEDRLALYRQSIWTCQCTGHTSLTHKEAWSSEAKVRVAAKTAVPVALQRPLLVLVHHSLSSLEQLIDAASVLCYSQYHVGEELLLLHLPKQVQVRVAKSKDAPKMCIESDNGQAMANGIIACEKDVSLLNGNVHGMSKGDSPGTSPGKENQAKEMHAPKEEIPNRKGMLPKFYDVITLEDQKLIENILPKNLVRPYKVPSKDQLRLFIRSCALRHRGTTCTPWVVADDLVKKYNIHSKLPAAFLSSPKPNQAPTKRKAQSPASEFVKRAKSEFLCNKTREVSITKVPPLIITSQNSHSGDKSSTSKKVDSNKMFKFALKNSSHSTSPLKMDSKPPWVQNTKHPLSLGKPNMFPRPSNISAPSCTSLPVGKGALPRKRGRPPLSKEQKERNKKLKQETLYELSKKLKSLEGTVSVVKIRTHCEVRPPKQVPPCPKPTHPLIMPYASPIKRANSPETIMKLPFMRRFIHENKTIKGKPGYYRRYASTIDLVLSKLSATQMEMIPNESLKHDILSRQKKVRDKKFFEALTPEERKQFHKDKARTRALERWKERKLRNLKIEDNTVSGLLSLPEPSLVETPKPIPNSLFGDIVLVTEFIKCFHELLLGEEKFQITTSNIMEAITAGSKGSKVIADIICCLLPSIIHDDICKNCKEIRLPISSIPITYQTAQELARLCLRKEDEEVILVFEEYDQLGKEKNELSDEQLVRLESCELWELNCEEIVALLTALVHKALCTAAISVYVEEVEEKVSQVLRERRQLLKVLKEQRGEVEKKMEERLQNRIAKGVLKKEQKEKSMEHPPKSVGETTIPDYFGLKESETEEKEIETETTGDLTSVSTAVETSEISPKIQKKEEEELRRVQKERQKQLVKENKMRQDIDHKCEELVMKRDGLLRRAPIGFDRNHNRYWLFHTTTPGLYVEKGWVHRGSNYTYSLPQMPPPDKWSESKPNVKPVVIKAEVGQSEDDDEKPLSIIVAKSENNEDEDNKPLSFVKSKIKKEMDEDNRPLSTVKSKLSLSPMKMTYGGRPPKEAYILVDEDTQTFPAIGENNWYRYQSMEQVETLLSSLSDQGQRESQLIAAINMNKDRLRFHFDKQPEELNVYSLDFSSSLKESLKEDIVQIEKELIEGWLGGVPDFEEWKKKAEEAEDVSTLGHLLIEAQRCMQIKYLKRIMAPVKEQSKPSTDGAPAEYEDVEGSGVQCWRDAVKSCKTYSRLHVLVGVFDSCIKWEMSVATHKCKVCRSKVNAGPLLMCSKCENSYHMSCLRPPLKDHPGELWKCRACMPKKIRREEAPIERIETEPEDNDQDEKNDPTFTLPTNRKRVKRKTKQPSFPSTNVAQKTRQEKECVICFGRIGLIFCSKCSTAYHSQCHQPPLLSRARKDWICDACINPKAKSKLKPGKDETKKPFVRRNYFGDIEEIFVKEPRSKGGRRQHSDVASPTTELLSVSVGDDEKAVEPPEEQKEFDEPVVNKFGRIVRDAKAKALQKSMNFKHNPSKRSRREVLKRVFREKAEKPAELEEEPAEQLVEESDEFYESFKDKFGRIIHYAKAKPLENMDSSRRPVEDSRRRVVREKAEKSTEQPGESQESVVDKFGRIIRDAKAKALENMDSSSHKPVEDSRRSTRNSIKRKNYKDESEEEESSEEVEEETEEVDEETEEVEEEEEEIEDEFEGRIEYDYSSDYENYKSSMRTVGEEEEQRESAHQHGAPFASSLDLDNDDFVEDEDIIENI